MDSRSDSPDLIAAADAVRPWRVRLMAGLLAAAGLVIVVRLVQLQYLRHDEFSRRASRIQTWTETSPSRPGDIVDVHGRLLATSIEAESLFLDPQRVADPERTAERLASVLPLDAAELARRLRVHADKRFLWAARRLSREQAAAVRALGLAEGSWGFRQEFERHYPQGPIAAHVLGLRDIDNVGRGGLEEAYDSLLCGQPGERLVRRDAHGFVVEVLDELSQAPRPRVRTTLDSLLQVHVEQRLDSLMAQWRAKSSTAIVMSPESGEILAMACRPAFDPAAPQEAEASDWKNQAIAAMFEPGSTIKPLVVAWALDRGLLQRDEIVDCGGGAYRMGGRVLHDHHPYGDLSVTDVLVKSSNIGMAKIGERLTNVELHRLCTAFGFGRRTGLGLPGELPGVLRPFDEWDGYSTGSIPMGQELAATPLQIVTAFAALANGGRLVTPRLVRSVSPGTEEGVVAAPVVAPVVSPETAGWIVSGPLHEVVTRGTGRDARIPGYSVFGKTGTAQVVDPRTGAYSHDRHICSFVCGAPVSVPRVVVLVVVEEPQGAGVQYGGTVAAPAARDILARSLALLGVPPDLGSEANIERSAARPETLQVSPR